MNYEGSLAFIHGRAGFGKKVGLQNMELLLARLGNPEKALTGKCIHVAGTNGKGSVCAYADAVLRAAGYKVGLYTSPYLMRYNERICLNGQPIPDEDLARITTQVKHATDAMEAADEGIPTVFEIGTAVALCYFCEQKVDLAVIEVGLGGRLDPTNVLTPAVCAICRIGLDHTSVLGGTVEAIAAEKAGIAKTGVPLVLLPQEQAVTDVIRRVCAEKHAPLTVLAKEQLTNIQLSRSGARFTADLPDDLKGEYEIDIPGEYQIYNALTALAALQQFRSRFPIPKEAMQSGLKNAFWPGRLEWIGNILIDGAHNPQGAAAAAAYIRSTLGAQPSVTLLCGIMADKATAEMVDLLSPLAKRVITVKPEQYKRAMDSGALAEAFRERGVEAHAAPNSATGLAMAKQYTDAPIFVVGSLYLAGEIRLLLPAR